MRERGFSLVEMLVAIAALAILASGAAMLTANATSTRDAIALREQSARDLLRLRSVLRADLTQAAARRPRDEAGRKAPTALLGAPYAANGAFLALVRRGWDNPREESRASLQSVEYRLRNGVIERIYRRHVDGARAEKPQTLIVGVESVHVSYMQFDQWLEAWAGSIERPLPRAVRLDIALKGQGGISQVLLLPETAP